MGGVGYDVRLGRSTSLTPYGTFTAVFYKDRPGYLFNFGLAVTLH